MKKLKPLVVAVLLASFAGTPFLGLAADQKDETAKPKLKPYTLKTCIISGDKLGEMGDPFVYEYKGREIKFCCKSCLKDFNKTPAKYVKKIEAAEAKEKEKAKK